MVRFSRGERSSTPETRIRRDSRFVRPASGVRSLMPLLTLLPQLPSKLISVRLVSSARGLRSLMADPGGRER